MAKALVVDDNAALVVVVGHFLAEAGFRVESAASGPEGLAKALADPPDAVILDIMMPHMDGYEVCRRLRSDPRTAQAVIVALTARGQPVDMDMALQAGADLHMVKPFRGNEMVETVQQLLAARRPMIPPLGYQILVLKLEEGAGATTLATNLGLCLVKDRQHLVVVADMALPHGQVAERLGLAPTQGWTASSVEEEALLAALVRDESGLFLLPASSLEETSSGVQWPAPAHVARVLQALREWYDYVVVDTGLNLGSMASTLVSASPLVLLLLTPEPRILQTAQASLAAMRKLGSDALQIWPVLSKVPANTAPLRQRVEGALGLPVRAVLPYSPEEFKAAQSAGVPVVTCEPAGPLAVAIRNLAEDIVRATSLKRMEERQP